MGDVGTDLGLGARLHWPLLLVQLAAVWAIALGARRWLAPRPASSTASGSGEHSVFHASATAEHARAASRPQ